MPLGAAPPRSRRASRRCAASASAVHGCRQAPHERRSRARSPPPTTTSARPPIRSHAWCDAARPAARSAPRRGRRRRRARRARRERPRRDRPRPVGAAQRVAHHARRRAAARCPRCEPSGSCRSRRPDAGRAAPAAGGSGTVRPLPGSVSSGAAASAALSQRAGARSSLVVRARPPTRAAGRTAAPSRRRCRRWRDDAAPHGASSR